jgi:hypothetical protein
MTRGAAVAGTGPTTVAPPGTPGADRLLAALAIAYFLILWLPGLGGPYGYFIDELYYLACAQRPAAGYVDHPPLSILLLAVVRAVAGDSLPVLRFLPAATGAAAVAATGLMARRLGAGTFGQGLAAGSVMAGGLAMVMFGFYSMNSLDVLLWIACFWILIDVEERGGTLDWARLGVAFGLGLLNKHTIVMLAAAVGAGMLLTRARRHLARRGPWLALAIALLLLLPNLVWQARNGWPSLEFYVNADRFKNQPTPPHEVLLQQVLFMNPAALPVWLAGLFFLLGRGHGGRLRHFGWAYLALLALLVLGRKSRPDRLLPAYPVLFAAGGVAIDAFVRRRRLPWLRPAMAVALVAFAGVLAPIGLPVLPPATTAGYGAALGIVPQIESGEGKRSALPQWLADRFGWEELARDVERVAATLTPAERARAMVLAPSYGQAGALERFGRGLPPVYGLHNNYHLWGPPPDSLRIAIALGFGESGLRERFEEVRLVAVHDCDWCTPWRDGARIWIARGPRARLSEEWPRLGHYE